MQNRDSTSTKRYILRLAQLLDERFSLQELKDICFNLNVDFENIPGEVKTEKAQSLTSYFERRSNLGQLVAAIQEARPDVLIEPPPSATQVGPAARDQSVFIAFLSIEPKTKSINQVFQLPLVSALLRDKHSLTTPSLTDVVQAEGLASREEFGKLIHQITDKDLILTSVNDPASLLRGAISFIQEATKLGCSNVRMGLHSGLVSVDPGTDAPLETPEEFINLTRRVMMLGDPGHILATSPVVDALKDSAELKSLQIQALGKTEIKYHVRVELYGLFDDTIGNPSKPTLTTTLQVLQHVDIPSQLKCAKAKKLKLTFSSDVRYSKVVFKIKNPDIQISSDQDDKIEDDEKFAFEYHRLDEGPYDRTFDVWAIKAETDSLEPIEICCYDKFGELIVAPVHGRISLRRRTPPPETISQTVTLPLWIWDLLVCLPWYGKCFLVIVLALCLVGAAFWVALRFDEVQRRVFKEKLFVVAHLWPQHYQGEWKEKFLKTADQRPDQTKWNSAPLEWHLVPGEGTDTNDKALIVEGRKVGLSDLHGLALYDFKGVLRIEILPGQRSASWILRAKDTACFYLFTLTFPPADDIQAILEGRVYKAGKEIGEAALGRDEVGFYHPFKENDLLWVEIEATNNRFKFTFNFADAVAAPPDPNHPEADDTEPSLNARASGTAVILEDQQWHYRYGSIGFWAKDSSANMKIESVEITDAK